MNFIEWLEKKKAELGLKTYTELADRLNIRTDVQSMILTGKRGPSAQVVQSIAESLDIWPQTVEFATLLMAAHLTNLENERKKLTYKKEPVATI